MNKQILAATVAGLFSIGAFAQASTPVDAPAPAAATEQASAPAAKHHHTKHHKHAHHHHAASAAGDAQAAPSNGDAAPVKP
ncbi:hypothetical protein A6V36_14280 [Paraburkholderia ginsengiterrae]|uniref:Uncharacterized protein n=1 Tax=Paraburkholderia ginsengiterrae TaxID=1462993 RepID=A0A1A9N7J5_9BURK|nr:hypothetical protein [Paraburkholderia ginsengiterrae]OAJ52566.1 hypothetical protein A6V36_14280 [Paraburkholderia ginsengiterrae]OAJ59152.1 hypothetical protein A6V37_27920 [Paraburkholderia ginsengiterrae]